MTIVRNRVLKL